MGFYVPAQIVRDAGPVAVPLEPEVGRLSGKSLPEGIASAAAVASVIQRLSNSIALAGDVDAGAPRATHPIDNA
jgi:hypothetical protein